MGIAERVDTFYIRIFQYDVFGNGVIRKTAQCAIDEHALCWMLVDGENG
ncbi:MAG TPA: hypothetical protein VF260_08365 [Bacilli bacterium]